MDKAKANADENFSPQPNKLGVTLAQPPNVFYEETPHQ
jgi:hypothetical protein